MTPINLNRVTHSNGILMLLTFANNYNSANSINKTTYSANNVNTIFYFLTCV